MKLFFVLSLIFLFAAVPVYAQELQVLDVVDDGSGELTLNLSKLTPDLSSYELFIDGATYGVFSGEQSSVTIPSPSFGEHSVEIIVTSRFTGARAKVSFILNFKPQEKPEVPIIPIPEFLQKAAKKVVEQIPGGDQTVDATSVVTTTAVATSSAVAASSIFTSLADLTNYLIHIFISVLEIVGIKKRGKPWGTVYDALTKKPLSFAAVRLLDEHSRILETKIADREGRYGFLVSPASLTGEGLKIQLTTEKKDYIFPSAQVTPPHDTVLYENVYVGGVKVIQISTAANFDLPMDPMHPPLKEVAKIPARKFHNFLIRLADAGFWVGLATAPLGYLSDPNLFSFTILALFLILAFFRVFGLKERPYGLVIDSMTEKPMSFALISLNDKEGHRKGFTVSDEQGRYFMVTEKGDYNLNVFTPSDVAPPRSVIKDIHAKRGWIAEEIKV